MHLLLQITVAQLPLSNLYLKAYSIVRKNEDIVAPGAAWYLCAVRVGLLSPSLAFGNCNALFSLYVLGVFVEVKVRVNPWLC